ncbi:DUF5642 family protein [Rhodococcus tibetensis]|uniref:DUF5642 family protein n=1 Tax=Rhodococcus tibetensis TaxID=2965064 RepID=A0ABT1QJ11_9NOCA|nr:DUF5642 family protein [Rhodococcus sp. FXJ9.536]MCQ4122246.1 DUF5642 family protein [Rhodococcus sp. FXJ9.536]
MSSRRTSFPAAVLVPVALLAAAAGVLSSCSSAVPGVAQPASGVTAGVPSGKGLSALLLDPSDFPSRYQAIVLPPQAVSMAAPDLTGVPQDAVVEPSECAPPPQDYGPTGTVMAVGTDNVSRSTITVELAKTDAPLDELAQQTADCGEITVASSGAESTVTTDLMPAPPIRADDTLALRRTVRSGSDGDKVTQSMATVIAQVGDVRVSATFMSFGDASADTVALDDLFTKAVQKVQAG